MIGNAQKPFPIGVAAAPTMILPIPRVQMSKVADLVDEHRTSRAARRRPTIDSWGEHKVVEDELPACFEQIEETHFAGAGDENILSVNANHWHPAALGG